MENIDRLQFCLNFIHPLLAHTQTKFALAFSCAGGYLIADIATS